MSQEKRSVTIVTEGQFDADFLKKIIGSRYGNKKLTFLPASGYSAALSKANSLLMQEVSKVLLIVDSDTIDPAEISEKEDFIKSYIRHGQSKRNFKLVLAIPELEVLFFETGGILQKLIKKEVSPELFRFGKTSPKVVLESYLHVNRSNALRYIDKQAVDELLDSSLIKEITSFIEG